MALIWIFVTCLFVWWISYAQEEDLNTPANEQNEWWKQSKNWWNSSIDIGINLWGGCLTGNWKWCFSYDNLLRWKDSELAENNKNRTVMTIAQDVVLGATYMVWTVLTIVLLYCWIMYIFSSWNGKDPSKYRKWLTTAAIGALLVWWAYAIVRLIQYIAKW